MRSRVQTISPAKAAEMLEANTTNRPLSRPVVKAFAEAMRRGDWMVTHQGIAFDGNGFWPHHRSPVSARSCAGGAFDLARRAVPAERPDRIRG